jgi:hypothetical protein
MNPEDAHHADGGQPESAMSDELLTLLRQRVDNRYYDEPRVIDAMARAMMPSFAREDHSPERRLGLHRVTPRPQSRS